MKGMLTWFGLVVVALPALGQEAAPVFQQQTDSLAFHFDLLARQEWTDTVTFAASDHQRVQLRPRLEWSVRQLFLGVGGDFGYGSDVNTTLPAAAPIRDNFDSRDARLDLAFARVDAGSWLRLEAGRFEMPVAFTEMIWDRDLRPQGAALTFKHQGAGTLRRLSFTALGAQGSHVFDDDHTRMLVFAGQAELALTDSLELELLAAYVTFDQQEKLEPHLRRQNTRGAGGVVALRYDVADFVARLRHQGKVPVQLVAEYSTNTAIRDDGRGIWLALVLGSTHSARIRGEFTYAYVAKDATLAAYATDDFLWETGWEGQRFDLGARLLSGTPGKRPHLALHAVGQRQRFSDSPVVADRDKWIDRLRLELRISL